MRGAAFHCSVQPLLTLCNGNVPHLENCMQLYFRGRPRLVTLNWKQVGFMVGERKKEMFSGDFRLSHCQSVHIYFWHKSHYNHARRWMARELYSNRHENTTTLGRKEGRSESFHDCVVERTHCRFSWRCAASTVVTVWRWATAGKLCSDYESGTVNVATIDVMNVLLTCLKTEQSLWHQRVNNPVNKQHNMVTTELMN